MGWFKKQHEPFPLAELAALKEQLPERVGLVNREEKTYFTATCVRLVVAPQEGTAIPTPELACTPSYYRDAYLPAWFGLSGFEQVDSEEFVELFGGVPEGDPTIAIVHEVAGKPRLDSPLPDAPRAPLAARGRSILHISDLHFGSFHGFDRAGDFPRRKLSDILAEYVEGGSASIGAIVASGDFISRGDANAFSEAHALLDTLVAACELDRDYVVIVPGNHDLWFENTQTFDRDFAQENPYRMFMRSFYGQDLREIEGLRKLGTTEGWTLTFLGLNAEASASKLFRNRHLNIAVLHHHLLPAGPLARPKDSPVSVTLDAGYLVTDMIESQIHIALHGHEHIPFVGNTARGCRSASGWRGPARPLYVLGSGSTGAGVNYLNPELRNNTFRVYTPSDAGLEIQVLQFNDGLKPEPLMDFTLELSLA